MTDDYVFDPEALAIEIVESRCSRWGGSHLTIADWIVTDVDVLIGFVAKPLPAPNNTTYEVVFFKSFGTEGAYFTGNLLSEMTDWAIHNINQLLTNNGFIAETEDTPYVYRTVLNRQLPTLPKEK